MARRQGGESLLPDHWITKPYGCCESSETGIFAAGTIAKKREK